MKSHRLFVVISLITLLSLTGCGGGGGAGGSGGVVNLNGALTITTSTLDQGNAMQVTFVTTYTNPQKADVIGIDVEYALTVDDGVVSHFTQRMNNSGTLSQTYLFAKDKTAHTVGFAARTGDLMSNQIAVVPPVGSVSLAFSPSNTVVFANTSTAQGRNSKGDEINLVILPTTTVSTIPSVPPFSIVNTFPTDNVSATIFANILTVKKESNITGGAPVLIQVGDSDTVPTIGTVTVNW